jgi:ATP-binding protein involved in chromosome partitioning
MESLEQQFAAALGRIEVEGKPLTETDIVHSCLVNDDFAKLTLVLPLQSRLRQVLPVQIEEEVQSIPSINRVAVEIVEEPPADEDEDEAQTSQPPTGEAQRRARQPQRTAYLQNYDAVIAVASGKGGVGKSTVSLNLALALQQKGFSVSFFDADIYGPSFPIMTGLRGVKPELKEQSLRPLEFKGLTAMSIGNLIDDDAAMVWRGPMVHQAIEQLLRDTEWPGGDLMIIDMPPGTGDVQLSISQLCELAGAVVVSTPQDVALVDAYKAITMFSKVDIPIVGIVENMSFFACPHCGTETPIFSQHGAREASKKYQVPFLGAIPIELDVREGGDQGAPIMSQPDKDTPAIKAFRQIADNVVASLDDLY